MAAQPGPGGGCFAAAAPAARPQAGCSSLCCSSCLPPLHSCHLEGLAACIYVTFAQLRAQKAVTPKSRQVSTNVCFSEVPAALSRGGSLGAGSLQSSIPAGTSSSDVILQHS